MAACLSIDHVVIHVHELALAMEDFTALGFTVVSGGEHPGLGSHNALIAFQDDTYLELIAFRPSSSLGKQVSRQDYARALAVAGHSPVECRFLTWAASPEGLVDFALVPTNVDEVLRRARQDGLSLTGPLPGSRLRPDGQRVAWQLALPDGFDLPFLCADVTPRSLRVPDGPARNHANGVQGIQTIRVCVDELAASVRRYRTLLGAEPVEVLENSPTNFLVGRTVVGLLGANQPCSPRGPDVGCEQPCALVLRVPGLAEPKILATSRSHGARIMLDRDNSPTFQSGTS